MGMHLHLRHVGGGGGGGAGRRGDPPASPVPKGWMAIRVGQEGEEQRRFLVPVAYLRHPLFVGLLKEAEEEYGFEQQGAITIPCHVEHFRRVQGIIDRDSGAGAGPDVVSGGQHGHFHLCFRS